MDSFLHTCPERGIKAERAVPGNPGHNAAYTLSLCSFALLTGTRQATLDTSLAISATNEERLDECNETMARYDSYKTPERSSVPKSRQNGSVDHKTSRSSAPRTRRCSDRTNFKRYADSQRELRQQGHYQQASHEQVIYFGQLDEVGLAAHQQRGSATHQMMPSPYMGTPRMMGARHLLAFWALSCGRMGSGAMLD